MKNIILVFFIISAMLASANNADGLAESDNLDIHKEISGSTLITDKQFQEELLEYLSLDEKLDYFNIYK